MPLYLQMKRELLKSIVDWDGEDLKFYSDEELCARFQVSRMTARQAVKELVDEGYLSRERGVGTFLNREKVLERPVTRAGERLSFSGSPFTLVVRKFERSPLSVSVAKQLGLQAGDMALHVVRIRRARGIAVSVDERWIPIGTATGLKRSDIASTSLVKWLGARYPLAGADMQFEGGLASSATARELCIAAGEPVLIRYLTYKDTQGIARMTGHSIHRSDIMRYSVNIQLHDSRDGGE